MNLKVVNNMMAFTTHISCASIFGFSIKFSLGELQKL